MANATVTANTASAVRRIEASDGPRRPSGSVADGQNAEAGPSSRAGPSGSPWPTVEETVARSTDIWARDLRAAYEHAKDRFADVCWEAEGYSATGLPGVSASTSVQDQRFWGHKAIIYARAPKDFKDRYFARRPPMGGRSPGTGSTALPPPDPRYAASPEPGPARAGPSRAGAPSSLSPTTLRVGPSTDNVIRLTHGDTPEMFAAQLEWLYTGEGFGDVVEWISGDDLPTLNASTGSRKRDSLGRRGNQADRRDKLGQDLAYMWRSKLYADIRIHLEDALEEVDFDGERPDGNESDSSSGSWSAASVFPAHRFILVSRSPYFASVLLNPSNFRPQTADVHLPMPPFTPAALHFCLGYIYAGHLDFSNRSFDLPTACQIYRAASYLQLEPLQEEIVSRLVHDFCHGLDSGKCRCSRCPLRAAAVWRFALAPDIGHRSLAKHAKSFVVKRWGDALGREIGLADERDRASLLAEIIEGTHAQTVVAAVKQIAAVRARIATGVRARGRDAGEWVEPLEDMINKIEDHARKVLLDQFGQVAESRDLWDLLLGKGFSDDLLERICSELVEAVGKGTAYLEAPAVYHTLVSSILLKTDPSTTQTVLPPRSSGRQLVEAARQGILGHMRRRWLPIRDAGRFDGLENWCLKEISDEIEVPVEDLLSTADNGPVPQAAAAAARKFPRTSSHVSGLADAATPDKASTRSRGLLHGSAPPAQRSQAVTASPGSPSTTPRSAGESSGLRRLRLSSSTSTNATFARIRPDQRLRPQAPRAEGRASPSPKAAMPAGRTPTPARSDTPPSTARLTRPAPATPTASNGQKSVKGPAPSPGSSTTGPGTRQTPPASKQNAEAGPSRLPEGSPAAATQSSLKPSSDPSRPSTPRDGPQSGKAAVASASSPSKSVASVTTTTTARTVATAKAAAISAKSAGKQPMKGSLSTSSLRSVTTPSNPTRLSSTGVRTSPSETVSKTAAVPEHRPAKPPARLPLRRPPLGDSSRQNSGPGQTGRAASGPSAASSARKVSTGTVMSVRSRITALESAASNDAKGSSLAGRRPLTMRVQAASVGASQASARPSGPAAAAGMGVTAPTAASAARAARSPGTTTTSAAPKSPAKSTTSVRSTRTLAAPRTAVAALQTATATKSTPGRSTLVPSTSRKTLRPSPSVTIKTTRKDASSPNATRAGDRAVPLSEPAATSHEGTVSAVSPKGRPTVGGPSSHPTMRSPSSSTTEEPGAVTPHLPQSAFPEPILVVQRDSTPGPSATPPGSAPLAFDSSKLALPPVLPIPPRPVRKVSTASVLSMASSATGSIGRFHPASAFDPPPRARSSPLLAKQKVPDGLRAFDDAGVKGASLRVGIPCIVSLKQRRARFKASVRYIGHLQGSRGVWVGIEMDDLSTRFGIATLPSGFKSGIHYFHVGTPDQTRPSPYELDRKIARRRQIERIRDSLAQERRERYASAASATAAAGSAYGLGLGLPSPVALGFDRDVGFQRSSSPYPVDRHSGYEHPRALFVRPSEVVFVIGAE